VSFIKKAVQESKTRFYQSFFNKPHRLELDKAIISVSFDDVPVSVFTNALPILDRYCVKATFYVACGLTSDLYTSQNTGAAEKRFLTPENILHLDRMGHDIACHTYSHYRLEQGSAEQMQRDAEKNIQALSKLLGDKPIEHFSYPFGQVSFKAKRLLSPHYKTMRGSRPGINLKNIDLYLLRAISVYNPIFNQPVLTKIIERAVHNGGWLIFYTHGVEDNPDRYDCTPEQLAWVLSEAVKSGAHILSVADAYNLIMGQ
jgi:peptidoglycan/xylan/chitin deacetylase (PgdA/CDA1 family)